MQAVYQWKGALMLCACALALLALAQASVAAPLTIALEPVVGALRRPVVITHAGDGSGRLFIVEQSGVIKIYDGDKI